MGDAPATFKEYQEQTQGTPSGTLPESATRTTST
jgi:hypothetical protein